MVNSSAVHFTKTHIRDDADNNLPSEVSLKVFDTGPVQSHDTGDIDATECFMWSYAAAAAAAAVKHCLIYLDLF